MAHVENMVSLKHVGVVVCNMHVRSMHNFVYGRSAGLASVDLTCCGYCGKLLLV